MTKTWGPWQAGSTREKYGLGWTPTCPLSGLVHGTWLQQEQQMSAGTCHAGMSTGPGEEGSPQPTQISVNLSVGGVGTVLQRLQEKGSQGAHSAENQRGRGGLRATRDKPEYSLGLLEFQAQAPSSLLQHPGGPAMYTP